MEAELIAQLDEVATSRGCTRSELLRDLARREVTRSAAVESVPSIAAVTLVYNHHVRLLTERLTTIQHDLGRAVQASMHVHVDHENCMEVIVLRGPSDELRDAAARMLSTRGVHHGGIELVTESSVAVSRTHRHDAATHAHTPASKPKRAVQPRKTRPQPKRSALKPQRATDTVHSPSPRK